MDTSDNKGPVEVIRDGAIKASIWSNDGEHGNYLTVTFSRTYTKEGEPQSSNSFSGRDLLILAEVARQAHCYASNYRAIQKEFRREPK